MNLSLFASPEGQAAAILALLSLCGNAYNAAVIAKSHALRAVMQAAQDERREWAEVVVAAFAMLEVGDPSSRGYSTLTACWLAGLCRRKLQCMPSAGHD